MPFRRPHSSQGSDFSGGAGGWGVCGFIDGGDNHLRGFRGAGGEGGGRQFAKPSFEGRGKYHFTSNDGDENSKNSSQ